jgi:DNA-binding XRE family transcriptional regulator
MKIKKLREQNGVTQVELAYATGIGRFKLFLFEKGYQEPTKQEVEKITS